MAVHLFIRNITVYPGRGIRCLYCGKTPGDPWRGVPGTVGRGDRRGGHVLPQEGGHPLAGSKAGKGKQALLFPHPGRAAFSANSQAGYDRGPGEAAEKACQARPGHKAAHRDCGILDIRNSMRHLCRRKVHGESQWKTGLEDSGGKDGQKGKA